MKCFVSVKSLVTAAVGMSGCWSATVSYEAAKVAPNNAVPCRALSFVKLPFRSN